MLCTRCGMCIFKALLTILIDMHFMYIDKI